MADEKDYNDLSFRQDDENGPVFGDLGEDGGSVSDYHTWDWKQVMAAIYGMAAGEQTAENLATARSVSDPQSLQNAANVFYQVQQTLAVVSQSLAAQGKALAGENGPWKGDAAEAFMDMVRRFSRQVEAASNALSGGAAGGNSVPQQLANNSVNLYNAQALVREIDNWYAGQAQFVGVKPMKNGLIPVSKEPEIVEMMNKDMRSVLRNLAGEYQLTVDSVRNPQGVLPVNTRPPEMKLPPMEKEQPRSDTQYGGNGQSQPGASYFGRPGMPIVRSAGGVPGAGLRGGVAGGVPGGVPGGGGLNLPTSSPGLGGGPASSLAGLSKAEGAPGVGSASNFGASPGSAGVSGGVPGAGMPGMPGMPMMPMMPGMGAPGAGGSGGSGGAGEPSDASGLLEETAEPWAGDSERTDQQATHGTPAGGSGLVFSGAETATSLYGVPIGAPVGGAQSGRDESGGERSEVSDLLEGADTEWAGTGQRLTEAEPVGSAPEVSEEMQCDDRVGVPQRAEDEEEDAAAWGTGGAAFPPLLWAGRRARERDEEEVFESGYSSEYRQVWGIGEPRENETAEERAVEAVATSTGGAVASEEPEPGPQWATWQPSRAAESTGSALSGGPGPPTLSCGGLMPGMEEEEEEKEEDDSREEEETGAREISDLLTQEQSVWARPRAARTH